MGNQLTKWQGGFWDPFNLLRSVQGEMNRVFDRSLISRAEKRITGRFSSPSVEVKEGKHDISVRADIPGIKKEDLHVSINGDLLTLKGQRKQAEEKKEKGYFYSERFYGAFERTLKLPSPVKAEKAKAAYKDGVLKLDLPKDKNAKPRRINLKLE